MLSWSLQQYYLRCTLLWPLCSSAEGLALMFSGPSLMPVLLTVKQMWELIQFFVNRILEVSLADLISSIAPQALLVWQKQWGRKNSQVFEKTKTDKT